MKVVELVVQSDRCGILWWRGRGEEWTHVISQFVFFVLGFEA